MSKYRIDLLSSYMACYVNSFFVQTRIYIKVLPFLFEWSEVLEALIAEYIEVNY